MPPTALSERDQAWIDSFGDVLAAKISPPKPAATSDKSLKEALEGAPAGSTIKWEGFDIVKPVLEAEAAAKTAANGQRYEDKGKATATIDGKPVDAEVEQQAKLLAPIEQPLSGLKFGGIEVGKLGLGLGIGLIFTETLNGVISQVKVDAAGAPVLNAEGNTQVNWTNVGAKYGLAAGFALVGPNFMGRDATIGAVAYPLAQAIGDTVPFDRAVSWLVKKIKGDSAPAEQVRARQLAAARQASARQNYAPQRQITSGRSSSMGLTTAYAGVADVYGGR